MTAKQCCSHEKVNNYTHAEMADLYFMYSLADDSMKNARSIYQEWVPSC